MLTVFSDLRIPVSYEGSTIIGGFHYASELLFSSSGAAWPVGTLTYLNLNGVLANQMVTSKSVDYVQRVVFGDPVTSMLDSLRDIAFRAAVKAGGEEDDTVTHATQTLQYRGYRVSSIYRTDRKFLFAALGLSLLCLLCISVTLYGWWQLGREVSMSPFEIAKAFDAPLLVTAGSNVVFRKFPNAVTELRVKYGSVTIEKSCVESEAAMTREERLVVDSDSQTYPPRAGVIYI